VSSLSTCLWFDGNADDAADFYVSIFPYSRRLDASTYGDDMPREKGSTLVVNFELDGRPFMALNGGPEFSFTPAVSLVVTCETQEEVHYYWDRLVDQGKPVQCGWLTDRFGLSWQVVPHRLGELASSPDPDVAQRVMQAMMKMVKIDIAGLEAAARG
jgi:predicted 3-demethylubiquinone-9 3-methyltransferase (glyoxalase superfamily)